MHNFEDIFGDDGPLARALPEFRPRESQLQMASHVAQALQQDRWLVVEAGTGTGKTFAYLVPALLSGKRVIVSTGTRTLQDQLFHRDLPLLGRGAGARGHASRCSRAGPTTCVASAMRDWEAELQLDRGRSSAARQHRAAGRCPPTKVTWRSSRHCRTTIRCANA